MKPLKYSPTEDEEEGGEVRLGGPRLPKSYETHEILENVRPDCMCAYVHMGLHFLVFQGFHTKTAEDHSSPHSSPSSVGKYFNGFIACFAFRSTSGRVCVHTHT